jgi:D-proline reductase (dithiol) PrdB
MATMQSLSPELRTFVRMYKWQHIDPVPWATPVGLLRDATVGLVVNACMIAPGQPPFHAERPENDSSMRVIPSATDPCTLVNTYPGQAFDHAGLELDANLLVPLDRLRDLERSGEIGAIAPRMVSLCGHITKPQQLIEETAPEIALLFAEDQADVVLLVPA